MREKFITISALALTLGLAGCSGDTTGEKSQQDVQKSAITENTQDKETKRDANETDENEVKDGVLTKPGQWTMEDDGSKVTLIKIKEANKINNVGPIKLTIESVKLFQYTNLPKEDIEYYKNNHDKDVTNGLSAIQIKYTVENTTNFNLMFNAVAAVTTDTKTQVDGSLDTAMSDDKGSFNGKVAVQGVRILPYFSGSLEDINIVNIITSDVYDLDNDMPSSLSPYKKIEIAF